MKPFACLLWCFFLMHTAVLAQPFASRVVATGLQYPWEVTTGPDNFLWITERTGKRITRVDPVSGAKTTAITISEVYTAAGQDGLLGMALHPNLLLGTGEDFVYAAYTYDADATTAVNRRAKIVRFTYDNATKTLASSLTLISNLPASNDHNSGRLKIGQDLKLYYTIGDQGANQFDNKCVPIKAQWLPTATEVSAQDWTKYAGKILRLNLNGTIPADNPLLGGVRSHIFSYGHRNVQGLAFGTDGKLYADEHGPKSDDEINLIAAGRNYGWPHVAGYKDGQAYVYGNWSAASNCASLAFSDYTFPAGVPTQNESAFTAADFTPPIKTLYTVSNSYNFQDPACSGNYFICWPTVGPSSLDIYTKGIGGIPGWQNSLLVVSLKEGRVYRLKLSADGNTIVGDTVGYFHTVNRYRDVALSNDGRAFYIVTDNTGSTSGPTTGWTSTLSNPGAILEFRYSGALLPLKEENALRPAQAAEVKVFPSLSAGTVRIHSLQNIKKPVSVQLYTASGVLLQSLETAANQVTVPLAAQKPGLYFLKVTDAYGNLVKMEKIVRQ